MALRSLLRKGPALAGGLTSPVSLRPRPPIIQALQQAARSRFLSHGPSVSGRQAVSEETLSEMEKRVDAEFLKSMEALQRQQDEFWRLEVECWAKLHRQLDTIEKACTVLTLFWVPALVLSVTNTMMGV